MKTTVLLGLACMAFALPVRGQEALIDQLQKENARLKLEIASLRDGGAGQCGADGAGATTVTLLLQKLSQLKEEAAIAALGSPESPIVLPDSVLSALVPGQFIATLAADQPVLDSPEAVAAAFGLAPSQVRYVYTRVLRGFSAVLSPSEEARLAADLRLAGLEQDGFVFPAQTVPPTARATDIAAPVAPQARQPSEGLVDVYVFDSGIRAGHAALSGLVGEGFTSFRNGIGTEDCNGHGTHVAGSIAGRQFGQTTRARLISIKVLDRDSYGDVSTVIAGVEWVLNQPGTAKIANMSLTRLDPAPLGSALLDRAVVALMDAGIPVVVAAGNSASDARLYSPARLPDAITVGAMAGTDLATTSNSGPGVDVYTEGSGIASASLADNCAYEKMTGTSMATARVTGMAAELLARGTAATDLRAALQAQAQTVATGDFVGETERHVLPSLSATKSTICDGTAREIIATPPRP